MATRVVHEERGSCRATSIMDGVSGTGRGFDAPETLSWGFVSATGAGIPILARSIRRGSANDGKVRETAMGMIPSDGIIDPDTGAASTGYHALSCSMAAVIADPA